VASVATEPRALPWHTLEEPELFQKLGSRRDGLTSREAADRLATHGPNILPVAEPETALRILVRQLKSVVVALLVAAALVAFLLGDRLESAAIFAVLVINTWLGFALEMRARQSLRALLALEAPGATVRRDGKTIRITAHEVVPGDVIIVEAGDRVPADARVIAAHEVRTTEAELTGESLPVDKSATTLPAAHLSLADRTNMLFMSTHVATGTADAIVVETGGSTEVGKVGGLLKQIAVEATPLELRLDALGKRLVGFALAAGVVVGVLAWVQGLPLNLVWETALALAIAAVPEGLPAVATVALAFPRSRRSARSPSSAPTRLAR
jgi:P-type Ca2+ transporter type 2C